MSDSSKKIPILDTKLSGATIENYLDLVPAGGERVWDVVTGGYGKPEESVTPKEKRTWKDANVVALLTIRKNCKDNVRAGIDSIGSAKDAYNELKKAYEGKTSTEVYSLLNSISTIQFDD